MAEQGDMRLSLSDTSRGSSRRFQPEGRWPVESWLAQIGWMKRQGGEGGLFVVVGRRPPGEAR
jgi:hypothetical protein